jgi:hypothetical protein
MLSALTFKLVEWFRIAWKRRGTAHPFIAALERWEERMNSTQIEPHKSQESALDSDHAGRISASASSEGKPERGHREFVVASRQFHQKVDHGFRMAIDGNILEPPQTESLTVDLLKDYKDQTGCLDEESGSIDRDDSSCSDSDNLESVKSNAFEDSR